MYADAFFDMRESSCFFPWAMSAMRPLPDWWKRKWYAYLLRGFYRGFCLFNAQCGAMHCADRCTFLLVHQSRFASPALKKLILLASRFFGTPVAI
jgi:hypothetical protein